MQFFDCMRPNYNGIISSTDPSQSFGFFCAVYKAFTSKLSINKFAGESESSLDPPHLFILSTL